MSWTYALALSVVMFECIRKGIRFYHNIVFLIGYFDRMHLYGNTALMNFNLFDVWKDFVFIC